MKSFIEFLSESRSFKWKGATYTSAFGYYKKNDKQISKEQYMKASTERYEHNKNVRGLNVVGDLRNLASSTAKDGYAVEKKVVDMFVNKEQIPDDVKNLLNMDSSKDVECIRGGGTQKSDIVVKYTTEDGTEKVAGVSIKLVKNVKTGGYNHLDRRSVATFMGFFDKTDTSDRVKELFDKFCGVVPPDKNSKSSKRMFMNEFSKEDQDIVINWLNDNKKKVLNLIFAGSVNYKEGEDDSFDKNHAADYILTSYGINGTKKLEKITDKIKEYDDAEWKLTPNGSLKLGNITLQRKGGSGQPDNIQFKIKIPGIKD